MGFFRWVPLEKDQRSVSASHLSIDSSIGLLVYSSIYPLCPAIYQSAYQHICLSMQPIYLSMYLFVGLSRTGERFQRKWEKGTNLSPSSVTFRWTDPWSVLFTSPFHPRLIACQDEIHFSYHNGLGYAMSFMRLSNITRKGFDMIIIVSSIFFACWRGCFFHLAKPSLMAWFLRFVIIFLFSFFGRFDMQQPLLVVKNSLSRRLCRICVLRKCTTTVNECFICTLYYSILQMSMPRSPWLCDERYCSSWDVNNVFLELKEKHQRKKDCRENREKNTTDQLPCLTNMG